MNTNDIDIKALKTWLVEVKGNDVIHYSTLHKHIPEYKKYLEEQKKTK